MDNPEIKNTDKFSKRMSIAQLVIAALTLGVSVVALLIVTTVIMRDDETQLIINGEKAYKHGRYERAYSSFSSTILYKNPVALAYLGYMESNGLGCVQNILAGSERYAKAVSLGFDAYEQNILYNTVNYSNCYYEISNALWDSYDDGNFEVVFFIGQCLDHQTGHRYEGLDIFSLADYNAAKNVIKEILSRYEYEQDRTTILANSLSEYINDDIESSCFYNIVFPNTSSAAGACTLHELCAYNTLANWEQKEKVYDEDGWYVFKGIMKRRVFYNQDFITQISPTIIH